MPTFTQEPYQPPVPLYKKLTVKNFTTLLIAAAALYAVYYLTPSSITSYIPNPFSTKSIITVTASGSVKATPDAAAFAATVASTGGDSNQALNNAKNKVNTLLNSLKAKGLADEDISIASYNVTSTQSGDSIIYVAGTTIIVTTPDIYTADALVSTALSQGVRLSAPLTYTVSNRDELEAQARDKAIANAETKAKKVASSFNKMLGRMLSYTEAAGQNSQTTESSANAQTPGEITISHAVQVSYRTK